MTTDFKHGIINLVKKTKKRKKESIMVEFSTITIKGKNVYLMINDLGETKWTTNKNLALCFNTDIKAKEYATRYFKNFKNWEVKDVLINFD